MTEQQVSDQLNDTQKYGEYMNAQSCYSIGRFLTRLPVRSKIILSGNQHLVFWNFFILMLTDVNSWV